MKLSIPERIKLAGILQDYKGSIIDLKIIKDLIDNLGFDEKEVKASKIKLVENSVVWGKNVKEKDIKIGERAYEIIVKSLKERDESGKLSMGDVSLWDKFVEVK
jgi:hypothetical protein